MYNNELKQQYIDEKNQEAVLPKNYLQLRFQSSSSYEEELQKDICNFTTYEIMEFYKMLNYSSIESLMCLNSQLSLYTQWCLQKNIVEDNQNHFLEITLAHLNSCLNKFLANKKIVDRKTVLQWCEEIPNPKDKFMLLSLFEFGKSKDFVDIVEAKVSDISVEDQTMHLFSGRTVKISKELMHIAFDADEERYYYNIAGDNEQIRLLLNDGHIVKSYPNSSNDTSTFYKGRRIYNALNRNFVYLGIEWMKPNYLVESGKIHMIKERAEELGMTPQEYVYSNHLQEVLDQYNCKIVRSTFLLKYGDFL